MEPLQIRAPRHARLMEIDWEDGETTLHPHRTLRGFCPCAVCQGHGGGIEWLSSAETLPDEALELVELKASGQYAVQLSWADGHATGIYTFTYLRELGALFGERVEALREKSFGR